MLMLFFIVLPVLGLLAIFFQPIRWVFMLAVVAAVAAMWVIHAFLFPGRMILTAVYGLLTVFTLINALTASRTSSIRPAQTMLVPTPVPVATDVPFASYGTMGTSVPEEYYGGMTADDGSVDGLTETGVTAMYLTREMDAGDIIDISKTPIGENETAGELLEHLAVLGRGTAEQDPDPV